MPYRSAAPSLRLHEELLLLALRDDKGTVEWNAKSVLDYTLAGAMLTELVLEQRVELRPERSKVFVTPIDRTATEDPLLDWLAGVFLGAKRRKQAKDWVGRLAEKHDLKQAVAGRLRDKGIVDEEEDRFLGIRWRIRYPERRSQPERRVVEKLQRAIGGDSASLHPRTAALVAMADAGDLLAIKFAKRDLKRRRSRIRAIAAATPASAATREAIEAMQAAIAAAGAAAAAAAAASAG